MPQLGNALYDSAQLCKPLHPSDGGISGMRRFANVVQQFVAVIRPHWNSPIGTVLLFAAMLFFHQRADQIDHIGVASEMLGFGERSIRLFPDVSQMREMNSFSERARDRRDIVARMRSERSGTQR